MLHMAGLESQKRATAAVFFLSTKGFPRSGGRCFVLMLPTRFGTTFGRFPRESAFVSACPEPMMPIGFGTRKFDQIESTTIAANSIWHHFWKISSRIRLCICVSRTDDAYRFWDQEIRPNRVDNMRTGQRPPDLGVLKRFRIGMGVLRRHQQLAKHGPADFFYGRTIAAKIESKT